MALPFDKRDARRKQRAEVRKRQILTAPARTAALFGVLVVPADGTSAATEGNGDFGTSPIYGQLSDKPTACLYLGNWGAGRKAQ